MKKTIRKSTAGWLAIAFAWMVFGLISPGPLKAGIAKVESGASKVETAKNSYPESSSFEKEGNTPEIAKKKKFPWLWVAAGAVVAGVIIYFTLIKKPKYDLTVEAGAGVTGNPAAGKYTYKKGKEIAYNFTCSDGYKNLTVLLDGKAAAGSGTLVMDKAHTLKVTAVRLAEYTLTVIIENGVAGTPASGTYQYREGTAVPYQYSLGSQTLVVTLDDVSVPQSGSFIMDNNHVLKVQIFNTLTVKIDEGIIGTPAAGTYRYRKGTAVPYQYSAENSVLVVKLDGNSVPKSGTLLMDKDHVLIVTVERPYDIRGKWRFWIDKEKHNLDISFSGKITRGMVDLIDDPDSYWWENFYLIGRIGEYAVFSSQVSIAITKEEYPIQDFTLSGYFTSTSTMTGTYFYYYSDPRQKSEGTWTASRIE